MSNNQKATQGNHRNPVIESPKLEGPVKPKAKPEPIKPLETDVHKGLEKDYRAQVDAVIAAINENPKTGKELILVAIEGLKAGKELLLALTSHAGDKDSPEVKAGMKAIKSRVAVDRNRLSQAVQGKAGSPDKLTESAIIRAKSISLNTFRTYR